ncbi:DUF6422 family protein [Streptomyces sp. NPDC090025]|uniref:DUF6422 family protein n=1 Tax=Streptomyces sp. NPDC090025 TaxID=3365922 RepID=UPI003839A859
MSYPSGRLGEDHVRALKEAARLIHRARTEAAAVLARSGLDETLAAPGALEICTGVQSPGPPVQPCGCPGFRGDSDFCYSQYRDFTGPDIGAGAIIRVCGHPRDAHESF